MSSKSEENSDSFYYCSGCGTSLFKKLNHLFEHRKTCPELLAKIKKYIEEAKISIKEQGFLEEIRDEISDPNISPRKKLQKTKNLEEVIDHLNNPEKLERKIMEKLLKKQIYLFLI